jgi:hypothetical protein
VRAARGGTKKLIAAFHFYGADQAGWDCGQCRRQGLEAKRRCGFLPPERRGPRRLVWARGRAATEECPKSLITPESLEFLEKYWVWKMWGGGRPGELTAREADAFLTLEKEHGDDQRSGVGSPQRAGGE